MMLALALAAALSPSAQEVTREIKLPDSVSNDIRIFVRENRLEPTKLSPKLFNDQRWEFDWLTRGYGNVGAADSQSLRLRVYSQERRSSADKAPMVARLVMQTWRRLYRRYKIDHPLDANRGIIDYYLCFGGEPGGEQTMGQEVGGEGLPIKVNTIYIYQLSSFKDPIEMAREVAHEYGHAVLPPVGGFKTPEDWGTGMLGEKLFLRWLRDGILSSELSIDDAMGATPTVIDAWVKKNVDPLVVRAATRYPETVLISEGRGGMEAFCGLALYVDQLCPPQVFTNALRLTARRPPTDFPGNVVEAASKLDQLTLSVPPSVTGKRIWIPLGKGTVSGASVVSRKNGWAEVGVLMPNIVIKNPPQ